jgi:hypothetical protein
MSKQYPTYHAKYYQPPQYYRYPYRKPRSKSRVFGAIILLILGGFVLLLTLGMCMFTWLLSRPSTPTPPPDKPFVLPPGPYNVVGNPSIEVDFINQVLERYDSPAQGKGQNLYDYGVKYHIDPAYALAFFLHESTFGTKGVAKKTLSLGNIRAREGEPEYQGYRKYRSWEEGFEAWYRLIANTYVKKWKLSTVDKIIPVYAPAEDNNDEQAYILAVKRAVAKWQQGIVEV